MVTFKRVLRMVRHKQNDNNEIKYSDYDILAAVNECIRYINQAFALKNSDFLERIKRYRQVEINAEIDEYNANLPDGEIPKEKVDFAITGVDLPVDFISLSDILRAKDKYHLSPCPSIEAVGFGTYKIFANRVYCATDFDLLYMAEIAQVKDVESGHIELPEMFLDLVVKVTGMILQNNAETDVLMQEITNVVNKLVNCRRYNKIKSRMPFYC